jgi:hypothetical protein
MKAGLGGYNGVWIYIHGVSGVHAMRLGYGVLSELRVGRRTGRIRTGLLRYVESISLHISFDIV